MDWVEVFAVAPTQTCPVMLEEGRVVRDEKISSLQRVAELPSEHRQLQLPPSARALARVRPTQTRARACDRQTARDQRRECIFKRTTVEAASVIQTENRKPSELDEERAAARERTLSQRTAARSRTRDDSFEAGDRRVVRVNAILIRPASVVVGSFVYRLVVIAVAVEEVEAAQQSINIKPRQERFTASPL